MKKINVAVVGATGLVGTAMMRVLEERDFPVDTLRAFATSRSAGSIVSFKGRDITVEDIESSSFKGVHCALFSGR